MFCERCLYTLTCNLTHVLLVQQTAGGYKVWSFATCSTVGLSELSRVWAGLQGGHVTIRQANGGGRAHQIHKKVQGKSWSSSQGVNLRRGSHRCHLTSRSSAAHALPLGTMSLQELEDSVRQQGKCFISEVIWGTHWKWLIFMLYCSLYNEQRGVHYGEMASTSAN